ncbi:MAG: 4Fe-4S dicluster domain-containing protein [Coriobacteriales bacterium]|jgi:molybdopterin-containing oxidoreductase family iron-sulfur binding subunit|nr:4Fe-4S dicluster domain-containing protein [Coriobacteriales bacterium]
MTKYAMVVDKARCVACNNCAMACKMENNLPIGVHWNEARTVGGEEMYTPAGTYPDALSMEHYTLACQHCDNPACLAVCPVEAISKREDGIVVQDNEKCIGCKLCMEACPYEGVRTYVDGEPQFYLDFAVGDADALPHHPNVVEKCLFCVHRIDRGERPACADLCRAMARFFGDLDDPDSEVSRLVASRDYERLLEGQGTGPNVYFLS